MSLQDNWEPARSRSIGSRLAIAALLAAGLLASAPDALASAYPTQTPAQPPVCGTAPAAVTIDAGDVTNTTTLDLSANGGTSIGDASGGDDNLAVTDGNDRDHNDKHNNKHRNRDKHDDDTEELSSAGNGGVAGASSNGGAIDAGDVNSGGNVGNAIAVGDTVGSGSGACGGGAVTPAVSIFGGTVTNTTTIDVSADGGTAIADASGGNNNVAANGGRAGDGGTIVTSAGNGGVANASANGGAISIGDINSGGNAGNAIGVGNTIAGPVPVCCAPPPPNPVPIIPVPGQPSPGPAPAPAPGKSAPGKVVVTSLPSTGSGPAAIQDAASAAILMALASGMASVAMRRRMA